MKFHYMGKFDGNMDSLPKREHELGAVMFKEPDDMQKFSKLMSIFCVVVFSVLIIISYSISKVWLFDTIGVILFMLCLVVHEFLHAICFKEDVYMYNNLKQGNLFVIGNENMTKFRFCFMSLLPCIILGVIPYILFFINNDLVVLGTFGLFSLSSCVGDWYNVFNALMQMPKGSKTYLCGFNSYWYMPEENKDNDIKNKRRKNNKINIKYK